MSKFLVVNAAGQVACKGFRACGQKYWESYGLGIKWRDLTPERPSDLFTWETREGAQRFAGLNGGTVTPVAEIVAQFS